MVGAVQIVHCKESLKQKHDLLETGIHFNVLFDHVAADHSLMHLRLWRPSKFHRKSIHLVIIAQRLTELARDQIQKLRNGIHRILLRLNHVTVSEVSSIIR